MQVVENKMNSPVIVMSYIHQLGGGQFLLVAVQTPMYFYQSVSVKKDL